MPHINIEHSRETLDDQGVNELVLTVHNAAVESGLFDAKTIKVRAIPYDHYLIAGERKPFIHIEAAILDGRTEEQKTDLAKTILSHVQALGHKLACLSVNVVDTNRTIYQKIEE